MSVGKISISTLSPVEKLISVHPLTSLIKSVASEQMPVEHTTRRRDGYSSQTASYRPTTYPLTKVPNSAVRAPEQGPLLGQWIRSKHGWGLLLLSSPQVNTQLQDGKQGKYTELIVIMHYTDENSLMNRYLIKC